MTTHIDRQREKSDQTYSAGPRSHTTTDDPLVRFLVEWRMREAVRRLLIATGGSPASWSVLVLCAGEGHEGRVLLDVGFTDVTVSDLSPHGAEAAQKLDPRLKTAVLNAEACELDDGSYDLVVVQDGLHHLPRPVLGFTEMLRISRVGALFLEPHDSFASRRIGLTWERSGDAENYVFRWTSRLVEDIASSFLGRDKFTNLSFSFWHHNMYLAKIGSKVGGGQRAVTILRSAKVVADRSAGKYANSFCGLVLHKPARQTPATEQL